MGALIWKSIVLVVFLIKSSLTSQSNVEFEKSANINVLKELKLISETKTTNQSDLDKNLDVSATNDDSTSQLSKGKHTTHFHYQNTDSDEIQIVYWYYDKISSVILGIFFGIALDIENAKEILKQPTGPSIAVFCKFILSLFLCYKFGFLLLPEIQSQFELIKTALSLLGFVAICWTVVLEGNIDLSIVMAIINIHLYFVVYPLWIALGNVILTHGEPNNEIDTKLSFQYTISPLFIVVSLLTGIFIQIVFSRIRTHAVPTLKTISYYYLLFYFALSLFCLAGSATLNLFYAGVILSIVGYVAGWFIALAFELEYQYRIAIGCESTAQNTDQFCTSIPMVGQLFINNIRLTYTPINDLAQCLRF